MTKPRLTDLQMIDFRLRRIERWLQGCKTVFLPQEAAEYMGISLSTLYKHTSAGTLPFSKPGGKLIYFAKADLDGWLLSQSGNSAKNIEKAADNYIATHK